MSCNCPSVLVSVLKSLTFFDEQIWRKFIGNEGCVFFILAGVHVTV